MKDFTDIQAYSDSQFREGWRNMLRDPGFSGMISGMKGRFRLLRRRIFRIRRIGQFRRLMIRLVGYLIRKTTGGVSWSGAENLPAARGRKKQGAIFISNHRSTSLDPMLFNYMLNSEIGTTAYNAAGDNLMNTPWLGHLIRLNRGFIVKRNLSDPDQKLEEAEKLSKYIRKLVESGKHVWIAQRNGRAKDGNDRTDSAVLAMIKMAHREKSWEELSAEIPIIPVSMSYEEIPLDDLLAKDHLGILDRSSPDRDKAQVIRELRDRKRRIHIHVSERIRGGKRGELVRSLDRKIIGGTRIWDSNAVAAELLEHIKPTSAAPSRTHHMREGAEWFLEKLQQHDHHIRSAILRLYAAPLLNRLALK